MAKSKPAPASLSSSLFSGYWQQKNAAKKARAYKLSVLKQAAEYLRAWGHPRAAKTMVASAVWFPKHQVFTFQVNTEFCPTHIVQSSIKWGIAAVGCEYI
jgi:hypothetical protein